MFYMKKYGLITVALSMVLCLYSCSSSKETATVANKTDSETGVTPVAEKTEGTPVITNPNRVNNAQSVKAVPARSSMKETR